MKILRKHNATIIAIFSLVIALTSSAATATILISSKQIKNGSVKSVDLQNGGIKSTDIQNDGVKAPDLGQNSVGSETLAPGSVESEALELPEPIQCNVVGATKINPTHADFSKLADVCTYNKTTDESALEVTWTGSVVGHNGGEASGCVFQLRANDAPSTQGGGEAFGRGLSPISDSAIFTGLKTGIVTVSIWAKLAAQEPSGMGTDADSCTLGPNNASIPQTVTVTEQVS